MTGEEQIDAWLAEGKKVYVLYTPLTDTRPARNCSIDCKGMIELTIAVGIAKYNSSRVVSTEILDKYVKTVPLEWELYNEKYRNNPLIRDTALQETI